MSSFSYLLSIRAGHLLVPYPPVLQTTLERIGAHQYNDKYCPESEVGCYNATVYCNCVLRAPCALIHYTLLCATVYRIFQMCSIQKLCVACGSVSPNFASRFISSLKNQDSVKSVESMKDVITITPAQIF